MKPDEREDGVQTATMLSCHCGSSSAGLLSGSVEAAAAALADTVAASALPPFSSSTTSAPANTSSVRTHS